jgi:arylsulfatase A-like enzyme
MNSIIMALALSGCGSPETPEPIPAPVEAPEPTAQPSPSGDATPNVLVLLWDTVRADRLTPYGYERRTTPFLDSMAKEGVVYERAVSAGIWTLPSHSSLFTGKVVTEHGVNGNYQRLDDEHVTIAEALGDAGYDTFAFSANPFIARDTGLLQGFADVYHPWDEPYADDVKRVLKKHIVDGDINGVNAQKKRKGGKHWTYQEAAPIAHKVFTGWLDERDGAEEPFFAFINLMEAHATRLPSGKARERLIDPDADERAKQLDQSAPAQLAWMAGANPMDEADLEALSQVYDATLLDLDRALAKLMADLEERQLIDNTLIVLTSDHGDALGDHERMGHQFHVYNSVSRVPLIVSWPGHVAPARVSEPKSTADLFELIVTTADIPVDEELSKALSDQSERRKDSVVTEYTSVLPGSMARLQKKNPKADLSSFERTYKAVEWDEHKLITDSSGNKELYQVIQDPQEETNVADDQPETVTLGSERIETWKTVHKAWDRKGETTNFDAEMQAGLEALGYVGGDEE